MLDPAKAPRTVLVCDSARPRNGWDDERRGPCGSNHRSAKDRAALACGITIAVNRPDLPVGMRLIPVNSRYHRITGRYDDWGLSANYNQRTMAAMVKKAR
jgi:hypothetical protein